MDPGDCPGGPKRRSPELPTFADIIIDLNPKSLDKTFQYLVPDELIEIVSPGTQVMVPFGQRSVKGIVVSLSDSPKIEEEKIKSITEVPKRAKKIMGDLMILSAWMKEYYACTLNQALRTCLPVKEKTKRRKEIEPPKEAEAIEVKGEETILTDAQKKALDTFLSDYDAGIRKPFLLYGVTGSGKTEVYIKMIEHVISEGKQAIVLIPEISLTYQTLRRFYARFQDKVAVIHSKLSKGQRSDYFEKAEKGEVSVMIGPRSAVFTPFPDTGLIIIDEEQETSYKSEIVPKYHAREVAQKRAEITGAALVFGSATPSLEVYEGVRRGKNTLLSLPNRVNDRAMARTVVVDMRAELSRGNMSMLSKELSDALSDTLQKKEQAMLFLNRRGLMGFISCRSCGHVIKCPHCDVSLTLHKDKRLHCHYCGHSEDNVDKCPKCGSKYIGSFKPGTEKVEAFLRKKYENARILRMDHDTTREKDSYEKLLSAFAKGEADILIGTQMIVKGHDFPNVTLMGILAADLSLNALDFRSAERTFDLITQAAGRSGRGEKEGKVIIQTYRPDSYAVTTAAAQDYEAFEKEEAAFRRLMSYPPFAHMLLLQFIGNKREKLLPAAEAAYSLIKESDPGLFLMQPRDAGISKIDDEYRMAVTAKDGDRLRLEKAASLISAAILTEKVFSGITVFFDFDPVRGF